MGRKSEERPSNRNLEFFGAITANVSHDLSNCVCVLDQVSGLLQDLMSESERGTPISPVKLATIRDRLLRQGHKAKELTEELNRFAHLVDSRRREFEVNSVLQNLISVSKRLAELNGLKLSLKPWSEDVLFMGDPFLLQQAVFEVLEKTYERATSGELIEVSVVLNAIGKCILISSPGLAKSEEGIAIGPLRDIADSIPAKVGISRIKGEKRILIQLLER